MSLSGLMSKGDYESRQKVEKKENERKKNILILIHQYLMNIGFGDTAIKLEEESNLELETYIVADNMDLYMILREYEDYYYMKFGRNPKFVQKISDGKMGGPLPKINGRNVNNKNQVPRKRGAQTPLNQNQQNNKNIDISNLKNNNNSQNTNNISNTNTTTNTNNTNGEIKLELNINSFNPKNNSQRMSYPNNKKNPNQQQQDDKYSFNDHKESILLKPLPSDLPDDMRDLAILIKREIILENPNVTFNDIIGLDTPKK